MLKFYSLIKLPKTAKKRKENPKMFMEIINLQVLMLKEF